MDKSMLQVDPATAMLSRIISAFFVFVLGALAATKYIYFKVKSDNATIDGSLLNSMHEGAAIDHRSLSSLRVLKRHNLRPQHLPALPILPSDRDNLVVVSPEDQDVHLFTIDSNNYLAVNGSTAGFYAATNMGDPYNYSATQYQAVYYTDSSPPQGSIPFTISVESAASPPGN
ncbi:hypothetical protein POJ06DRAFT_266573 [Lipomyces tetrasporus]|uniref:Uncharacterized protein n=1 Tax=Lipomyces tetrasporus TaxID=54092 RepID=A0AAD7VTC8_9ASCO|nr:uncharacterized protein POJ06DRAFT_266573 [Lipomyces tetrasporus]KAJ8101962.1 hypothetical protein POJ06DRAFT_266573 [Lipomyces tetrasporus]